jgi:Potassium-transporting ATPase A subunit
MFTISPAPAALASRASRAFSSPNVKFSPAPLRLERRQPATIERRVRPVHRAQRHPHRLCDRRLRHSGFPQQNHLDALTKDRRLRPPQTRFNHRTRLLLHYLLAPNQMASANSFMPLGGAVLMMNMMLDEVIVGSVGSGL